MAAHLPDTPVGRRLGWVFETLLTGRADEAAVIENFEPAFLERFPPESVLSMTKQVPELLGEVTITSVKARGEHALDVGVLGSTSAQLVVTARVSDAEPHRLAGLGLRPPEGGVPEPATRYRAIVLNGVSSAGKSTLAKALQVALDGVWLHVEVDAFLRMLPPRGMGTAEKIVKGTHASIAALVSEGLRVIYDTVLEQGQWHDDLKSRLGDDEVLWVGVHCSPEALDERERARGDRMIGQARLQLPHVHASMAYGVEVDTSAMTTEECAAQVAAAVAAATA